MFGEANAGYGVEALHSGQLTYWDGTTHSGTTHANLVLGQWHHVALSVDSGNSASLRAR